MLGGYTPLRAPDHGDLSNDAMQDANRQQYQELINKTAPVARMIQLRCIGFTPNARQHRMFGLAALEIAQLLRGHLLGLLRGAGPASVPSACSSSERVNRAQPTHQLGWRDLADIAVRWRQISEPNDAVWWIDRLPEAAFKEGFGLQTPMFTGQMKTIRYALSESLLSTTVATEATPQICNLTTVTRRYYSYFAPAFEIMKRLMPEQCPLTEEQK